MSRGVPRILFFGGDEVSVVALHALCTRLTAVLGRAGEATGGGDGGRLRGPLASHITVICPYLPHSLSPSAAAARHSRQYPVTRYAAEKGLPVYATDHPTSFAKSKLFSQMLGHTTPAEEEANKSVRDDRPSSSGIRLSDYDVAVVVSFRYFIPLRLLRALPHPILNMHPSLLPRYRGASPIFSTLLHEEEEGGVTIIELHEGEKVMDGGRMLWQRRLPLFPHTDLRQYFPVVTRLGAVGLCHIIFGDAVDPVGNAESDAKLYNRLSVPLPSRYAKPAASGSQSTAGISTDWTDHFPSLHSDYCDWPETLTRSAAAAVPQDYPTFSHFTEDPHHAPLLPKHAAALRFSEGTAAEVFRRWRAFVGGDGFGSTVNATFLKHCTPIGQELVLRSARQMLRRELKRKQMKEECIGVAIPTPLPAGGDSGDSLRSWCESITKAYVAHQPTRIYESVVSSLMQGCCFTEATAPCQVPAEVLDEVHQQEEGPSFWCAAQQLLQQQYDGTDLSTHKDPRHRQLLVGVHEKEFARLIVGTHKPGAAATATDGEGGAGAFIPPGSLFFPSRDETIGAVKCRVGWFFWRTIRVTGSTAQPAALFRKGYAMKCGVVYVGLLQSFPGSHLRSATLTS